MFFERHVKHSKQNDKLIFKSTTVKYAVSLCMYILTSATLYKQKTYNPTPKHPIHQK